MKRAKKNEGFTLIELLLVVVVIGLMLAVIVPRAWRANIDAKYGLVRQAASELAAFGHEWTEQMITAAPDNSVARSLYYYASLSGTASGAVPPVGGSRCWVANPNFNWVGTWTPINRTDGPVTIAGRGGAGTPLPPECPVIGVVTPEKHPRNPFNGASYFTTANYIIGGGTMTPGALACCSIREGGVATPYYFAFLFQGTDSTSAGLGLATSYHAGQDPTDIAGLRNGIFFARTK